MSPMRPRPFRPGFDHTVEAPPDAVDRALSALLAPGAGLTGRRVSGHLMLTVPEGERHFWSPYLHLEVRPHRSQADRPDPARAYVRGFFTPHPSLFSGFVFTYLVLFTLFAFAAMWACVELVLDQSPTALVWCAGLLVPVGLLYAASRAGRGLAAEQMDALHARVEAVLASVGTVSEGAGETREVAPVA